MQRIMPYATIQPPFTLKLREMPKKELHRYCHWFMDVLPQRIGELAAAVRETPGFESWQPDCTPASLDALGQWFAEQVETRSRTQGERQAINDRLVFQMDIPAEELTNRTFSLAMDIGMYFSQVLMKNYPSLKWEQPLGNKRFADYGQPCLVGFGPVSPNPVRIGHVFAHGLADKTYTGKRLREVYDYWAKLVRAQS
jgi:hypothetical protein